MRRKRATWGEELPHEKTAVLGRAMGEEEEQKPKEKITNYKKEKSIVY